MGGFSDNYNEKITHWVRNGDDGYGGYSYGAPVVYAARVEQTSVQVRNLRNEVVVSQSWIWCDAVMKGGDYIFIGENVGLNPLELLNGEIAYEILNTRFTPALTGSDVERIYFL